MKYCENCFAAFDLPRCPLCGGRKVREIKEDDYCLLTERSAAEGEMLADVLRGNEIPCVTEPSGCGVRTVMALPLENRKLFVPWRCFSAARTYLREIAEAETEKWRQYLLENADKLHLSPKLEKKIVKKSRGACGESVIGFCKNLCAFAERIEDGGTSYGRLGDGHDIICYAEIATAIIDSATLEILSVSFKKH